MFRATFGLGSRQVRLLARPESAKQKPTQFDERFLLPFDRAGELAQIVLPPRARQRNRFELLSR